ncbi:MAG: bifunctional 3-(3-hydroxy-phenyl)propionate/3-hydroxycinnamic acid hydroxylase [Spirochaetaceae bacterium]|nr:bifunctional 3-(3-hydroxy-phenyl)propionate/3-hydroxycinnamic acid hydroxylase [Spirochaetaceae bacterium]
MPCERRGPYDVAVVGFGPTGAVLANLLGLCGLRVVVLERAADIHRQPRAVHFDGEVMRIFQTIGVADRVAAVSRVNAGMRFVDPDGRLILDWPRPQQVGPQGWHPSYRFHQPDLEAILRDLLHTMPNVDVLMGADAMSIDQGQQLATVTYREDQRQHTLAASYVVGCDGARSLVRERITDRAEDLGFHERWLVVDLLLRKDRPILGDFTIQYCHPQAPATYVRGPGRRRRWEISIGDLPDTHALARRHIWHRLARWLTPSDADVERAAVYTFHSVIASSWRRGRLLIAGDAAHQSPPFMGQGMCAGIRDAANLAWKLALCIRHGHDDALLDTYQSERHPHVRAFIKRAVDLGRLVNASDSEAALKSAFRQPDGSYRMTTIAPRLGPGLWQSDCPAAGHISRQLLLKEGGRSDGLVGYATSLLVDGSLLARWEGRADAVKKGIHVWQSAELHGVAGYLAELGTRAVSIRPDRYVHGTANEPATLDALVKDLPPIRASASRWRTCPTGEVATCAPGSV